MRLILGYDKNSSVYLPITLNRKKVMTKKSVQHSPSNRPTLNKDSTRGSNETSLG